MYIAPKLQTGKLLLAEIKWYYYVNLPKSTKKQQLFSKLNITEGASVTRSKLFSFEGICQYSTSEYLVEHFCFFCPHGSSKIDIKGAL